MSGLPSKASATTDLNRAEREALLADVLAMAEGRFDAVAGAKIDLRELRRRASDEPPDPAARSTVTATGGRDE